jgi:ABC-2 type transport system permease protein
MEEKTNRIAEVIVSSVKPFQLMLGKIIRYRRSWPYPVCDLDRHYGHPQSLIPLIFPEMMQQVTSGAASLVQAPAK